MTAPDLAARTTSRDRSGAPVVHLHIGTMKTGTSYLQRVLSRNTDRLEDQGVRFPSDAISIGKAARDVIGIPSRTGSTEGHWQALVDDLQDWDGRSAVVSSEFLSFASAALAKRAVTSLWPCPVEIVVTARDLARLLPSAWQNKVKHGKGWTFERFVEAVVTDPTKKTGPARAFWHHHDLVEIVERWAGAAGPEHVTVVTLPPSGAAPDLLWQRFAAAIDVNPTGFDTSQDQQSNLSLGYTEAELLRRVNQALGDRIDKNMYQRHVRAYFANVVLRPDPDAVVDKPLVPSGAHDWTITKSREMVGQLRDSGVRVIGNLDDLIPAPLTAEQRAAADAAVPPAIPAPAVRAVAALLLRLADEDAPRRGRRDRPNGRRRRPPSTDPQADDDLDPGDIE